MADRKAVVKNADMSEGNNINAPIYNDNDFDRHATRCY